MSFINNLFNGSSCSAKDVVIEISNCLDSLIKQIIRAAERFFTSSDFEHSAEHYITQMKSELKNLHDIIRHDDDIRFEAESSKTLLDLCERLSGHRYQYHIGYCFDGKTFLKVHDISLKLKTSLQKVEQLTPINYQHEIANHNIFMSTISH